MKNLSSQLTCSTKGSCLPVRATLVSRYLFYIRDKKNAMTVTVIINRNYVSHKEMIKGETGRSSLQFRPFHENSVGRHGSPCQFFFTLYTALIFLIASTSFDFQE